MFPDCLEVLMLLFLMDWSTSSIVPNVTASGGGRVSRPDGNGYMVQGRAISVSGHIPASIEYFGHKDKSFYIHSLVTFVDILTQQ